MMVACTISTYVIQPNGSYGDEFYVTEDGRKTWSRVNDDLHEYGGTGNGGFIVGDYNVYGRCCFSTAGMGIIWCDKINKE